MAEDQDESNEERGAVALSEEGAAALAERIKGWGEALGFSAVGIADPYLADHEARLNDWLARGHHGEMSYMAHHGVKRTRPEELVPGTQSVIAVRLDYLPAEAGFASTLADSARAFISRYALGRDYHKLMRKRLQALATKIEAQVGEHGYRVFVDSAPVMERALAARAGLGAFGKNTMLISETSGSWFFLGEIYTDLPLPTDASKEADDICGRCTACLDICPTGAFTGPYELDARRCISYLTIEQTGSIPQALRPALGNRVFGCDDCQLVCPWNQYAQLGAEGDFQPRHGLDRAELVTLFQWSEATFEQRTRGSAIRRVGYEGWLRNLAVGLGNADYDEAVERALSARRDHRSALVREHVEWALGEQRRKRGAPPGGPSRLTHKLVRAVRRMLPRDA